MSKKNDKNNSITLKLRDVRKEKGLSLTTLADKLGMDHQRIGRMERGESSITIDTLSKLAAAMDVPMTHLLNEADDQSVVASATDDSNLSNIIPLIYEQLDQFCIKHKIEVENNTKVQLATMMYRIVQDIRVNVKDDANVVKALFQGFDTIFERLVLTSEKNF